jgi:hypothetical protein
LAVHHYQANILINEAWHAVLADFGLAVFINATANTSHSSGSTRWMVLELSDPKSFDFSPNTCQQCLRICVCLPISRRLLPVHIIYHGCLSLGS